MSDDLERIFLRVRSKYCLPGGVLPDTDGLAKVLLASARATPLETFKCTAELVLQVLKKSTNECLRNGYIQAMSRNDVQTAQTCLNILQNQNNSQSGSISQTEYPSCLNHSSFRSADKNLSSLSNKPAQNENYRLDASVSLVRSDSNLHTNNPLAIIAEKEEENARNSNVSRQVDNRAGNAKVASGQSSASQNERGKKHRFSQPSSQTRNVEQEVSPKRLINSRPVTGGRIEENEFVKMNEVKSRPGLGSRLHQRSGSEDSEELFRPSQSKKPSPQNKRQREEADYTQVNSKRDESMNRDSSEVYSSPQHLPRKTGQPRNRTYRRQYTSESEDDNSKSKFNRVFENKKRAYSKKSTKQCYSDSDIPSPTKTKVRSSKSKRRETSDSESENDRKRSRTGKNKLANRRERIHTDSDSREPSYRQDPKPRRSRSAGTKSSKRSRSYPSETSQSPNSLKYKRTEKLKRGKPKPVYSDSEVVMDTSSQRKPARRNKKTLKDSEPRSAKSQSKITEKADKKEVKKPAPTKARNNAGKSDVKSTNRRKKSVASKSEEEDNLPSTSKDLSKPSKSNPLKFMSKLKELESSILNGTPDPLPTKTTNNSKKSASAGKKVTESNQNIQDSAKRVKPHNKKTPTKSPLPKNKQKTSKVNKKTTDKPSAAQSRAAKAPKPGAEKNPRKKPVCTKSKSASDCKSTTKEKPENVKTKGKKTVAKKPKNVETVSQSKETIEKETKPKEDEENTEVDKNMNSLLSSDESFRSDSELEAPLGSLSTCLNSIKRQMPRQVGTATPPLRIFLSTNSDILSDASETSSFDRVPIKLDDKNVVKRMAKANRPKQMDDDQPTTSKPPEKLPETPETLRKMMKINKKFEEKQDSDVECSSFSDN